MRRAGVLILAAIGIAAVFLATIPAFAWYWPIFGFNDPGWGLSPAVSVLQGNASPLSASPFQSRAELIIPGYAYYNGGPHHGSINFGPFGRGSPGFAFPFGSGFVWDQ